MCWMVPKPAPPPQRLRRAHHRPRLPPHSVRRRHHQPHRYRRKAGPHRPLPRHLGLPPHHLPRRPLDHRPQRRLHKRPRRQQARLLPHPPRPPPRRMFRVPARWLRRHKRRRNHRRLRPHLSAKRLQARRRCRPAPRRKHRPRRCRPPWLWCPPGAPRRSISWPKAGRFRLIWGRIQPPPCSVMVIGRWP